MRLIHILLTALFLLPYGAEAGLAEGNAAFERGDYKTAIREWESVADKDAEAQFSLGLLHYKGIGVEQDFDTASKYFELAYENGHAAGAAFLGASYMMGRGVEADVERANQLFHFAAGHGNAMAMFALSQSYLHGIGVSKDFDRAEALIRESARDGYVVAMFTLGRYLLNGLEGFDKDVEQGARLLCKADGGIGNLLRQFGNDETLTCDDAR